MPPFKPEVKSDTDVSNFDKQYTDEPVQLSPPEGKILQDLYSLTPEKMKVRYKFLTRLTPRNANINFNKNPKFYFVNGTMQMYCLRGFI